MEIHFQCFNLILEKSQTIRFQQDCFRQVPYVYLSIYPYIYIYIYLDYLSNNVSLWNIMFRMVCGLS